MSKTICSCPNRHGFLQHDCQEFLALLLDSLHEQMNLAKSNKSCQIASATATTATVVRSNQNGETDDEEPDDNEVKDNEARNNGAMANGEKENGLRDLGAKDNGIRTIPMRNFEEGGHVCFSDLLFSGHCHDMDDYDLPLSGGASPNQTMAGSPRGEFIDCSI